MGQIALIVIIIYLAFSKKNDFLTDVLSSVTPEEIQSVLNILGIDQTALNSALNVLPDLLSGDVKPAELIKKSLPLLISFLSKGQQNRTANGFSQSAGEGFEPVADFIPDDVKNDLSAFFN